jgi:VanZ family protein
MFSTDSFSSARTATVVVQVLKSVFPFLSADQLEVGNVVCRKAGHILEFFVLGMFTWRAFSSETREVRRVFLFSAAFVLAVAMTDEFHQSFVPSRTSSFTDVGYDFIGGLAALALISRFRHETRALYSHTVL